MAPPNNGPWLSDININSSPCLESNYLRPATLDSLENGSSRKRKPDPAVQNTNKSAKKPRERRKEAQLVIQKEIEELDALEKENKELDDEETALKAKLQDMRNVYMDFIKKGQIVFIDDPSSTSSITSASSTMSDSSPVQQVPQMTTSYQTSGQTTPEFITPPPTPQDLVLTSMLENSIPSIYEHHIGYTEDPSSSAMHYVQIPVIQSMTSTLSPQWAAPPTPEDDVLLSPQHESTQLQNNLSLAMPSSHTEPASYEFSDLPTATNCQGLVDESILAAVEIDLDSINSIVIDAPLLSINDCDVIM